MNNSDFTFAPNDPPAAREPFVDPVGGEIPPPPQPDAPAPARRGFPVLTLLLFLILAGGLYVVWADPPELAKYTANGALPKLERRVQALAEQQGDAASNLALAQQVQALTDRVDRLEKAPVSAPVAAAPTDSGDLAKQLADLSQRVDALANRPAPEGAPSAPAPDSGAAQAAIADLAQKTQQALAAQNARLDAVQSRQEATAALASRVDGLEKSAGRVAGTADRAALLTRVQAAEVALLAGQKLGSIPGAPPALQRFANIAPPTDAQLREEFPDVADRARGVSQPDLAKKSFLQRSWARLQQSVTVRQGDDVLVGDPAAGVLADAQAKVQSDDLQGAVLDLQKLHGAAADAVAPWVDKASALLAARTALATMAARN